MQPSRIKPFPGWIPPQDESLPRMKPSLQPQPGLSWQRRWGGGVLRSLCVLAAFSFPSSPSFREIIWKISDGGDRNSEATIIKMTWISQPVLGAELRLCWAGRWMESFTTTLLFRVKTNTLLPVHWAQRCCVYVWCGSVLCVRFSSFIGTQMMRCHQRKIPPYLKGLILSQSGFVS